MGQIPTEYLPPRELWPPRIYTLPEFTTISQRFNSTEALPDQTVAAGGRVPGSDAARHRSRRPRNRQAPPPAREGWRVAANRRIDGKGRITITSRLCFVVLGVLAWVALAAISPAGSAFGKDTAATPAQPQQVSPMQTCVGCHKQKTPGIVEDWQLSKHARNGVECAACHGDGHTSAKDTAKADIPTPETCSICHAERVAQFKRGKHAAAWAAMKAMPTTHYLPMALTEGMKGCGGCHKIGLKSEKEIQDLSREGHAFGVASCDACHTRHTFSVEEARQPQACQTCHMGFDHPQWEMYASSKHGVRYLLKQAGVLPGQAAAPTCQTCHMPDGDHGVKTSWGFLAVRLPMPADKQWAADRATILQGLGVLDLDGKPTARLDVVKAAAVARLTQEEWQAERDKMIAVCGRCHSEKFAKAELAKGDDMIRQTDRLMAEAIRVVASLYKDGIIAKPASYAHAFPDLLTFHDAATPIELRLFRMFLEHRMRAFQGTFHANPDYALWYGWSEMVQDLAEIRSMAGEMRHVKSK